MQRGQWPSGAYGPSSVPHFGQTGVLHDVSFTMSESHSDAKATADQGYMQKPCGGHHPHALRESAARCISREYGILIDAAAGSVATRASRASDTVSRTRPQRGQPRFAQVRPEAVHDSGVATGAW